MRFSICVCCWVILRLQVQNIHLNHLDKMILKMYSIFPDILNLVTEHISTSS